MNKYGVHVNCVYCVVVCAVVCAQWHVWAGHVPNAQYKLKTVAAAASKMNF